MYLRQGYLQVVSKFAWQQQEKPEQQLKRSRVCMYNINFGVCYRVSLYYADSF